MFVDDAAFQFCPGSDSNIVEQDAVLDYRLVLDEHPREEDGVVDAAARDDDAAGQEGGS